MGIYIRKSIAAAANLCLKLAGPSRGGSLLVCGIAGGPTFGEIMGNLFYEFTDADL